MSDFEENEPLRGSDTVDDSVSSSHDMSEVAPDVNTPESVETAERTGVPEFQQHLAPVSGNTGSNDEDSFISDLTDEETLKNEEAQLDQETPPATKNPRVKGQKFILSGSNTEVYVTESPSKHQKIVILLTNSLGLASVNNLVLADTYAARLGIPVVVPDLFDKDPITTSAAEVDAELGHEPIADPEVSNPASSSFWSSLFTVRGLKSLAVNTVKGFVDEMWLARHTYEKTLPQLSAVVSEIIQIYSPRSVGIIGYSFGGKYVMGFLEDQHNNEWSSDEDLVTVGASIHPSLVEADDFNKVGKPLLILHAKDDPLFPESLIRRGISILQENSVEHNNISFSTEDDDSPVGVKGKSNGAHPTLPHGFAVPGDYSIDLVGDMPSQVINIVCNWVLEHI